MEQRRETEDVGSTILGDVIDGNGPVLPVNSIESFHTAITAFGLESMPIIHEHNMGSQENVHENVKTLDLDHVSNIDGHGFEMLASKHSITTPGTNGVCKQHMARDTENLGVNGSVKQSSTLASVMTEKIDNHQTSFLQTDSSDGRHQVVPETIHKHSKHPSIGQLLRTRINANPERGIEYTADAGDFKAHIQFEHVSETPDINSSVSRRKLMTRSHDQFHIAEKCLQYERQDHDDIPPQSRQFNGPAFKQKSATRNFADQIQCRYSIAMNESDGSDRYMNPTYGYSQQQDTSTTSHDHLLNLTNRSSIHANHNQPQHKEQACSISQHRTSRSPLSLSKSCGNSKASTPHKLKASSITHNRTSRLSLPVGMNKTSTPYKVQQGSSSQSCTTRSSLPVSKTSTPHKLQSHNTSIQSEGIVCRICHDGDGCEVLISPCYCAGSMGLLHVSCLQRWLGSSNKTTCEICAFQFELDRKTMPITKFFEEPGTAQDKKHLICDIVTFILITPLTAAVIWANMHGALGYYKDKALEKGGLLVLSFSLLVLYLVWLTIVINQKWNLWRDWKMFHQEVTLLCTPAVTQEIQTQLNIQEAHSATSGCMHSRSTVGKVQIESIRVSVHRSSARYKAKKSASKAKDTGLPHSKPIPASVCGQYHTHDTGELQQALEFPPPSSTMASGSGHPVKEHDLHHIDERQHKTSRAPTKTEQYYNQSEHSDSSFMAIAKSRKVKTPSEKYLADDQHGHYQNRNFRRSSAGQSSVLNEEKQWHADKRNPNKFNTTTYNKKHYSAYSEGGHQNNKEKAGCVSDDYDTHDSTYAEAGHIYKNLDYSHPETYVDQGNINIAGDTYMNAAYIPGNFVSTGRLEQSSADYALAAVFSRGNSPQEEAGDNVHDYTADWVNDQSKERVLAPATFQGVTSDEIHFQRQISKDNMQSKHDSAAPVIDQPNP